MAETIGRRSEMNGISIVAHDAPVQRATLFGVFDGHGGREAVEYASANLPGEIVAQIAAGKGYPEAFEAVHGRMAESCTFSGTTAAVAVIHQNRVTVAGVGDTRCVLARAGVAVQLTVDHRPDLDAEAAHILSKGGRIEDGRVNGVLEISRTLGDSVLGECVRATPDVQTLNIGEDDQFLILACGGVWSVMSNQEAVDLIAGEEDPVLAARKIRDTAFERDSADNISVIVISLKSEEFAPIP
jgi:serine/threonine protein phosphatase PrpC